MVRNSIFRPGFGQPLNIELYVERLIALFTSIPGPQMFEEFCSSREGKILERSDSSIGCCKKRSNDRAMDLARK
jgi:hypothetical protein